MAINRTWFNNLVDDDGSGTKGTIWNKTVIAGLLDSIDLMFGAGTWTPTDASGAGLVLAGVGGRYIALGTGVLFVTAHFSYPTTSSPANAKIGGLPFPVGSAEGNDDALVLGYTNIGSPMSILALGGSSTIGFFALDGTAKTNTHLSGKTFGIAGIYRG